MRLHRTTLAERSKRTLSALTTAALLAMPGSGMKEMAEGLGRWIGPGVTRGAATVLAATAAVIPEFVSAQTASSSGAPTQPEMPPKSPPPPTAPSGSGTGPLTAIQASGDPWGWGANAYGQVGDGTTTTRTTPVHVIHISAVVAVAAGGWHTLALKSDGTVWAWGSNYYGTIGDGTQTDRYSPVQVSSLTNVVAIAANGYHSVALKRDGTVWTWGRNDEDELGVTTSTLCGSTPCSTTPVQVTSLGGVIAIGAGGRHTLVAKNDGTVWAWGQDDDGQVGSAPNGSCSVACVATPTQVSGLNHIVAVAGGWTHSLALDSTGQVWAFGNNSSGQLGNNTTTNSTTPVKPLHMTNAIAIAAGDYHSLSIETDGSAWAWGNNQFGQLGATSGSCGSYACSLTPIQVTGLTNILSSSGGYAHSLAEKGDGGTLQSWGLNTYGELGNGTTTNSSSPGPVSNLSFMATDAAGEEHSAANDCVIQEPPPLGSNYNPPLVDVATSRGGVVTTTGSYSYSQNLLSMPGRGPSPSFSVTYNSDDSRFGALAAGWTHSYAIHLALPGAGSGAVIVLGPQGRSDRYTPNGDGTYTPPPGVTTALTKNSDGTWTATQKDLTKWSFDACGRLNSIADRAGNTSSLTYNSNGQLTGVSDPAGRGSLSLGYDTNGRLSSVTDWQNHSVSFTYSTDSKHVLTTITDRSGKQTTFCYGTTACGDGGVQLLKVTDGDGHTLVTNAYDSSGRVSSQTDGAGNTTNYDYSVASQTKVTYPATSANPSWRPIVTDTFDSLGRLLTRASQPTNSETDTTTDSYSTNGFPSTIQDPRGNTTTLCWDVDYTGASLSSRGNLTRVIAPAVTDARTGNSVHPVTLYKYDANNNLTETVAPDGVNSTSSTACTDNLSNFNTLYATDNAYNSSNLVVSTTRHFTDPDLGQQTATTQYQYNDSNNPGLVTAIISPRNNTTTFAYYQPGDPNGQQGMLKSITGPPVAENSAGNKTTYTYDSEGHRLTMVDPLGNVSGGTPSQHTWTWTYDNQGRITATQVPAPSAGGAAIETDYNYDAAGNRSSRIDAHAVGSSGQVTKFLYDSDNRLQEVDQSPNAWTDPNATPSPLIKTVYTYDQNSNLQRVTRDQGDSSNERATDYTYDGQNRVTKEVQYPSWPTTSPTLTTTYSYDQAGNRTSLLDPLNQTTSFGYDALNRLTSVTYTNPAPGTSSTSNVTYSYDLDGNRHSMVDSATTNYCYDELDRLTSTSTATASCPPSSAQLQTGFRYDLDGNRRKLIYPDGMTVSYTLDAADRLQSLSDSSSNSTTSYTYVPDSRLASVSNFNGTSTTYTWDNARRLQEILHKDGTQTLSDHAFTLDALGNRTHFSEQLPIISGLAPSMADTLVADQLQDPPTAPSLDELAIASADAALPVTGKAEGTPQTIPVGPPTRQSNRPLPFEDSSSKPERPALFHAEPTGHTLDVLDKASPTASVQVQHAWTKASIRFELPGVAAQRAALGNKATAQVGDLSVNWTSFDDHLKEDLVLSKAPTSNSISFNVQMHGLAFAKDGHGGWILNDADGLSRFQLPAPTVKDALGNSGNATLDLTLTTATITVDAAFLTSATYPVTVDPNINYTLQSFGTDFTYDSYAPVSDLKTVAADQTPFSTSTYTFDPVRNRTQLVQGPSGNQTTSNYTYDRADRILTSGTSGNITDTVDANGNLKSRTGGSVNDSFSYDQANRLTSATTSAGSGTYRYDGDGKRTTKTVGGTTTNYVYDIASGLPQLLSDGTHKFVWGTNGLAYNIAISGGAVATYHADQIGSIREITNADGSVRTTYLTDEYGNRTTVKGADDQPFQFTGEQVDPETGFVYLRARYYDPGTGRFTTSDYFPSDNRFAYAANNPINFGDPTGLQTELPSSIPYPPGPIPGPFPRPRIDVGNLDWDKFLLWLAAAAGIGGAVSGGDERPQQRYPLVHYTSKEGLAGILATSVLFASTDPVHARYGPGQYFTDILPEQIGGDTLADLSPEQISLGMMSKAQVSRILYGVPWAVSHIEAFVVIDAGGLPVENRAPHVFLVPGIAPLEVGQRIMRAGTLP